MHLYFVGGFGYQLNSRYAFQELDGCKSKLITLHHFIKSLVENDLPEGNIEVIDWVLALGSILSFDIRENVSFKC